MFSLYHAGKTGGGGLGIGINKRAIVLALWLGFCCLTISGALGGAERLGPPRNNLLEKGQFIQIPGPNPIIMPGGDGAWDSSVCEASDAIEDLGVYYFYYHATGGKGYQLGVASATNPLGPFKKHGDKPVLEVGPAGSWDSGHVACAMIVKEGSSKYLMWYSGYGGNYWDIGLASAEHPLGPWTKHEGNPVLKGFGYMGGVIKHDGKYRLYSAHPISADGYKGDYSPLALAIGDKPEGPFEIYHNNPIMVQGDEGDWDDGGISEAEVLYHNGMYHMFYGGTRLYGPRLEDVGYAYSLDGIEFFKYGKNPVLARKANPNAAAFAEVHVIIEMPYIYLYHTLRPAEHKGQSHPWVENLGVQVLVTQRPFSLDMPALNADSLAARNSTRLENARPIAVGSAERLSLTVECRYAAKSKKPLRIHVRSSYNGLQYDTADLYTLDNDLVPGEMGRKTFELNSKVRFIKVQAENLDKNQPVTDLAVIATLGG